MIGRSMRCVYVMKVNEKGRRTANKLDKIDEEFESI